MHRDDGAQAVEALAAIDRFDSHPNPPSEAEAQHGADASAATSRATVIASVASGTRTSTPLGNTTSTKDSATARTGTNVAIGGIDPSRRTRSRRQP